MSLSDLDAWLTARAAADQFSGVVLISRAARTVFSGAYGWDPVTDAEGRIADWKQNIFSYRPIGSPDGGAHATVDDLVRFLRAVRAGELLSAERTEQFLTPQVPHHRSDDGDVWYGFGLAFTLNPDGSVWNYYKDGGNAGACAIACHYPADDLDVVMLSNAERGGMAVIREIDRRIRALP